MYYIKLKIMNFSTIVEPYIIAISILLAKLPKLELKLIVSSVNLATYIMQVLQTAK